MLRKFSQTFKNVWGRFDDSLFRAPKEHFDKKDFKGQNVYHRKLSDGGPQPTSEQVLQKYRVMEEEEIRIQPRDIRMKNFLYGMAFLSWYIGGTLFIMYRMKGDDLDDLEREVSKRQSRKKQLAD